MLNEIRLPTRKELALLPLRALTAFSTRFARRLFAIVEEEASESVDRRLGQDAEEILTMVETAASYEHMQEWAKTEETFGRNWFLGHARRFEMNRIGIMSLPLKEAISAVADTLLVIATLASVDVDGLKDDGPALMGATEIVDICSRSSADVKKAVWEDFCCIRDLSARQGWTDSTSVSPEFWVLHSRFDLERLIDGRSILSISSFVSERLVTYFRRCPDRLYQLTPRQFEELIAEIWAGLGFEVELTTRTVDGGCDIVAVQHVPSHLKYLIECKRYRPDLKIGVHVVRQLGGVVLKHLASRKDSMQSIKGILATTSRFTKPSQEYLRETKYWLAGADSGAIIDWLKKYDQMRLRKVW